MIVATAASTGIYAVCQLDCDWPLQTSKHEGLVSLERDLKDLIYITNALPSSINVSIDHLNDGSGIATLLSHNARYHQRQTILTPIWKVGQNPLKKIDILVD